MKQNHQIKLAPSTVKAYCFHWKDVNTEIISENLELSRCWDRIGLINLKI